MVLYNSEIIGATVVPAVTGRSLLPWTAVTRGDKVAFPYSTTSGYAHGYRVCRFNLDGTCDIGPMYEASVGSVGAPRVTWIADDRLVAVDLWYSGGYGQTARLFSVDEETLALTLLDSTTDTSPYAQGDNRTGHCSPGGVVCLCWNKYDNSAVQHVPSADLRTMSVCRVVGDSFTPWTQSEHSYNGYHTASNTAAIGNELFFLPWCVGSGAVLDAFVYNSATDVLTLASRECDPDWPNLPPSYGPGFVPSDSWLPENSNGYLPDGWTAFPQSTPEGGYSGFLWWRWNGNAFVAEGGPDVPLEGYDLVPGFPEYTSESQGRAQIGPGPGLVREGDVWQDDFGGPQLGVTLRPDSIGTPDLLYCAPIPEGFTRWLTDGWGAVHGRYWVAAMSGSDWYLAQFQPVLSEISGRWLGNSRRFVP